MVSFVSVRLLCLTVCLNGEMAAFYLAFFPKREGSSRSSKRDFSCFNPSLINPLPMKPDRYPEALPGAWGREFNYLSFLSDIESF